MRTQYTDQNRGHKGHKSKVRPEKHNKHRNFRNLNQPWRALQRSQSACCSAPVSSPLVAIFTLRKVRSESSMKQFTILHHAKPFLHVCWHGIDDNRRYLTRARWSARVSSNGLLLAFDNRRIAQVAKFCVDSNQHYCIFTLREWRWAIFKFRRADHWNAYRNLKVFFVEISKSVCHPAPKRHHWEAECSSVDDGSCV